MLSFPRQFHLNTSFYKLQSETYTPIKQVNLNGLEHSNFKFYLSTDVNGFKFQILFFFHISLCSTQKSTHTISNTKLEKVDVRYLNLT